MPQRTSKAIDRAWADSFANLILQPKQPTGPGWLTIDQIKDKLRVGWSKAYGITKKGVKEGHFEVFHGQQRSGKRICRETWYRPVSLKGQKKAL